MNNELNNLIEKYIQNLDVKLTSITSYESILSKYSKYMNNKNIQTISRNDILKYKEYISKSSKAATIQKHIVVIRNFYRWIQTMSLGLNITEGIKGAKIEQTFKREALTFNQASKLLEKAKRKIGTLNGSRNYAIVLLLMITGLRTIEVERANVEDLNRIDKDYVLYIQGKGRDDKDLYVKLPPIVYEAINDYLKERGSNLEPLFTNNGTNNKGTRIKTGRIREVVKDLLYSIGISSKKYSAHSLRHTAATLNLKLGATMEETQQLLRHKNIATTLIYSHHLTREKNNSEYRIADALASKGGQHGK